MERVSLGGGPLPMNDQKKSILMAGGWVKEKKKKAYRKMIRFSVCASDFSSQRKNMESDLRDFSLPILLMPFDGREKIPMCLRIQGGAFKSGRPSACQSTHPR